MKKGFTIIELLVIISIIAILSSIMLAYLHDAKDKAKDANVQASLNSSKNAFELYFNTVGDTSYGHTGTVVISASGATGETNSCSDSVVEKILKSAAAINNNPVFCSVGSASSFNPTLGTSYAAFDRLNASGVDHAWCVDSWGYSGDIIYQGVGATYIIGGAGTEARCK